jgi:hydroxymethylpyrimidine/phosphomethylpyrimidine kinase
MEAVRPIVLSIAGFDPCGGAGILADIKTFEQHKVLGLAVNTAQTLQTEDHFISIKWESENDILTALKTLLNKYDVTAVKIGVVENIDRLKNIISFVHQKKAGIKIIVDPVIKSSSGFVFWNEQINEIVLKEMLAKVFLLTPNYNEVLQLMPSTIAKDAAQKISAHCNVLLKGGHNEEEKGVDYLFTKNGVVKFDPGSADGCAKHGSGCVLSAAITANIALGFSLQTACTNAKKYIEQFLSSNKTLLGYHHV